MKGTPMKTPFEKQLTELMPQVDKVEERFARLRQFLRAKAVWDRWTPMPDEQRRRWADETMARHNPGGWTEEHFPVLANDFRGWWATEVTKKRRASATKPKAKPGKRLLTR
jgi:hypothetical protein